MTRLVRLAALMLPCLPLLPQDSSCRTPLGVPCHTLERTVQAMRFFRSGATDLARYQWSEVRAYGRDGSFFYRGDFTGTNASNWLSRTSRGEFFHAPENRFYRLDHVRRTWVANTASLPGERPHRRTPASNTQCLPEALGQGKDFQRVGEGVILGWRAIHWHRDEPDGSFTDLWYAPELDCQLMKSMEVLRNDIRIPVSITLTRVTAIHRGEPSSALFTLPPGYGKSIDSRQLAAIP